MRKGVRFMLQSSLDKELLTLVVNQCLAMALRDSLSVPGLDADDISSIEYRPVWTLENRSKKLLKIQVRISGQKDFSELNWDDFEQVGFSKEELLQFFETSDAVKVKK